MAAADLGGTEQAILNLGESLAARGHRVAFGGGGQADIDVAVNDATLLPVGAGCPVVWFHNEVSLWRELRRCRFPALWRHRPAAVFCGTTQARAASRMLPLRCRTVLPHGLPARILSAEPAAAPPPPHAIFVSQAYRGLAGLIRLWAKQIAPALPAARLSAYIAPADIPAYATMAEKIPSIAILPRQPNAAMPAILKAARVLLAPGHRAETFCLAAAEAGAMGVPVITLGIGALRERVQHGKTGYICRTGSAFAAHTRAVLTDDALWHTLHAHALVTRKTLGWDNIAERWETHFDRKT